MTDTIYTKPITVTILDIVTGERVTDNECSAYWWAEGNGSCDCNRAIYWEAVDEELERKQHEDNPELKEWQGYCYGSHRFLIVEADTDAYTLDELNSDYPQELKAKHLEVQHA